MLNVAIAIINSRFFINSIDFKFYRVSGNDTACPVPLQGKQVSFTPFLIIYPLPPQHAHRELLEEDIDFCCVLLPNAIKTNNAINEICNNTDIFFAIIKKILKLINK